MSLSQTGTFVETIIDLVDGATRANIIGFSSNNKLVLNGAEGPDGGSGIPWGGLVGSLIQRRVCFDTTEAATPCILPSSSLLDNLNRIRWHHQPATWFEMSPTDPRSMRVNVASGIWYKDEADRVEFIGGNSPIITSPATNPRIDVVYLTASGMLAVSEGVESASPTFTIPSGIILPIGAVYVTPVACGIGWPCDTSLYSGSLYSGYIHKDLRPFITYPGGGGGAPGLWTDYGGYIEPTDPRDVRIGTGQKLYPEDASGQDLGDATHLWDVFASYVYVPDDGVVGVNGGPQIRYDSSDGLLRMTHHLSMNSGNILPVAPVGQLVGDATHRWDIYARLIDMSDAGWIGNSAATARLHFDSSGATNYAYFSDCNVGIGDVIVNAYLGVVDATLETTTSYLGIQTHLIKTAGVTDAADHIYGNYVHAELDQGGGTIGHLMGLGGQARGTAGTIGINITGLTYTVALLGATVAGNAIGIHTGVDADTGTITTDVKGINVDVDLAATLTSIGGSVYGVYIDIAAQENPVGNVYMLYLREAAGVNYGIYQSGSALNTFGGDIDPANVAGQSLGDAGHRWNLYTTAVDVSDGGTVGQAAGPLVVFDDTNDYLEITGCRVSIGHTTPVVALDINTPTWNHNGILLGSGGPPAVLGMVKFTGSDFFGYTPSGWLSLTASGTGGGGGVSLWTDHGAFIEPTNPRDVRIGTTRALYPEDAAGQNLGDATHRWDIAASFVDLPDNGWIGIAGNELLTVDDAGSFLFSGVTSIVVPDGCWVGANGACAWLFDDGNDVITAQEDVGIGIALPTVRLHLYHATADVLLRIETDLVNGEAHALFVNDAQAWRVGITALDRFLIRDSTAGVSPFTIEPGADANSIYVDADGHVGHGGAPGTSHHLYVIDATIDTTATYYGFRCLHTRTGGATDHADAMTGVYIQTTYNNTGVDLGHFRGIQTVLTLTDGDIGNANIRNMQGFNNQCALNGGTVTGALYTTYNYAVVQGTTVDGAAYGLFTYLNLDSGTVSGIAAGIWSRVDDDLGVTGTVYNLYLDNDTGVDYAIYSDGTAPHYLGGDVGIGTAPATTLDVNGILTARSTILVQILGGNQVHALAIAAADTGIYFMKHLGVNKVALHTNGSSYLNGGNVGIGEAVPQRLLHVDGRVRIDDPGTEPGVTAGGGFTHYYGSLYYFCGRPDQWLRIDIEGTTYHIPCYL